MLLNFAADFILYWKGKGGAGFNFPNGFPPPRPAGDVMHSEIK